MSVWKRFGGRVNRGTEYIQLQGGHISEQLLGRATLDVLAVVKRKKKRILV